MKTIGYIEPVKLVSKDKEVKILAKVDTGAHRSSIDVRLASELGLRIVDMKTVKNVAASQKRVLVNLEFLIAGKRIRTRVSVADRNRMEYPMIIGRIDLKGFLVDPSKRNK